MNLVQLYALALQLEVSLEVEDKQERVIATPAANVTDDLRVGVKENRDELMRDLLVRRAICYVWKNQAEGGSLGEINTSIPHDELEGMSFGEFRLALGRWAAGIVNDMKEDTFKTEAEVFDAFRVERDRRCKEVA